jgi:hypothetical protein
MFVCALAAFLAVHCVAEESSPDPLAQLPMFVLRFLQRSFAVHCVAEDCLIPLAQLPMFALRLQRSFAVHCVAEESSTLILWHQLPMFVLLLAPLQHLCCRGVSTLIPTQLPMFEPASCSVLCSALCYRGVSI